MAAALVRLLAALAVAAPAPNPTEDGYRGIWFTLGQRSAYGDKYSGGLGTYTAKHIPLAIYSPEADKTFFVYGGGKGGTRHLLAMASYYDHKTGRVPRPTIVHDKGGVDDPHDNPSMALDDGGHIWVFVSGRGRKRPGFVYRSLRPHDVSAFERIVEWEMTYPQPWWVKGRGFLLLFTKYTAGRELYVRRSADGRAWEDAEKLAGMGGHYQVSAERDGRVITAFNRHPGGDVDRRTDLYFAETDDMGRTWRAAGGTPLELPLRDPAGPARIRDYAAEKRLVYLKNIGFDPDGNPAILFLTASSHEPGPPGEPRIWTLARWTGKEWRFGEVARSTHNYDMGSLWIDSEGIWRIIAPTEPGPQPWGTGGEMALWRSLDRGATWTKVRDITRGSEFNHAYARRPIGAHPEFYAFWADGNPDSLSPSRLYFTNRDGDEVRRLPYDMPDASAVPEVVEAPLLAGGPHLLIDDYLIDRQEGIRRRIRAPSRLPHPVVTGPEDKCFQPYVTVLRDPRTGRFRIWYGIPEGADRSHLATMESEDGIHWIRPHRRLADPGPIQFGASIIDEGPAYADPAKRFKYGWWYGGGLRVAASSDGLVWTPLAPDVVLPHNHDIDAIARDPIRNRYIAMVSSYTTGPTWTERRRVTMTSTSEDLIHWREPWYALTPDSRDEGETQFYCMGGIIARGDLLVGMLRVLRDDLPADPGGPVAGIGYTVLAWSRDGETWARDREPFFDRNPAPGSWDRAMSWIGDQIIVGDETYLYYGGYARGHKIERFTERQIGLARMPRDRYVAREAGEAGGRIRTRIVRLAGSALAVNAEVEGELRVRIVDPAGEPIPGFDWLDADPIRGDSLAHPVRWKAPLASLGGRGVRVEFSLRRGRLYGFELGR